MSDRKPIVGGNWKMNTTLARARELAGEVRESCASRVEACDVVVYPPFPYLSAVAEVLAGSGIRVGAQDVFDQPDGAFTGEVSTGMLLDLGVTDVLAGHSERRHVIGEDDDLVNRKARAALAAGLRVVLCVGETIEQREAGETEAVNRRQVEAGLAGIGADRTGALVIAYEPVWAIGTGRTASPQDAQAVHELIRSTLADKYGETTAKSTRIQYGGSVRANNAASLFGSGDIDGGLIGGASLKGDEFAAIVLAAADPAR